MPEGTGKQEVTGNQAAVLIALKALAIAAEPYRHCGCSGVELARAYDAAKLVIHEVEGPPRQISSRGFC
jgi:hypothetical protein